MMISCARPGREYGSELLPEQALEPAPEKERPRGLNFICLNANISRQFEFLQNAWVANTKFSGLSENWIVFIDVSLYLGICLRLQV